MRDKLITVGLPLLVAVIGLVMVGFWLKGQQQPSPFPERLPGMDNRPANVPVTSTGSGSTVAPVAPTTAQIGTFVKGSASPSNIVGSWPHFRGVNFDAVSPDGTKLARAWAAQGPPVLWSVDMGEGYAGAAVLNGCAYVLDYDESKSADALRCLSLADGREVWRRSYAVSIKRNHGISRTVPAVTDKYCVTLGPMCHVMCVDAISGQSRWGLDLVKQFGTAVPEWYAGQCPIIDNGRAIIAPGGSALMIAVDCASGKIIWQTPNPNGWRMTHASILPIDFGGKRMYVYCASGGVVGVDASNGAILWSSTDWTVNVANIPTPIAVGGGKLFICGGYNAGSITLQLSGSGNKIGVTTVFKIPASVFGSGQQTPAFYNGYLYGVAADGQLVCLDLAGKRRWASGTDRFGLGPYTIGDGLIFVLSDDGRLVMAEASPAGYRALGQAKLLNGPDAWGPMSLTNGRLILRDLKRMICVNVGG